MNITRDHRAVRNQASIDMASAGAGAPSLKLYTAEGGTFLGQRTLASPCGSITAEGRISLLPAPGNDLVVASGAVGWAGWCDGDGVPVGAGAVTDSAGAGPFKLGGTAGTMVYEGGLVLLSAPALLG